MKAKIYNIIVFNEYWKDFDCGVEYSDAESKRIVEDLKRQGQKVQRVFVREEEQVTLTVKRPKP